MISLKRKEWTKFKVGKPSKRSNWSEPNCQPLDEIAHVSHINSALNIFEQRKIKAGLVFDKSRLNTERISVVWLSPNDWGGAGGFRYGNIRFNFDWKKAVRNLNCYWVESIAYGIQACRILLSSNDYNSKFQVYDPSIGDGPWWYDSDNDVHYWNGNYCLEVMIEKDLRISDAIKIDFVDHHSKRCSIDPNGCPDAGLYRAHAGARFIATLVGRESRSNISNYFDEHPSLIREDIIPSTLSILWRDLSSQVEFAGNISSDEDIAQPLSRAILNCYGNQNYEEMDRLSSLFKSDKALLNSCAMLIGNVLHIPECESLISGKRQRRST